MAELIAIAKALKIPVSKGDVNGSAVYSINALAWVVPTILIPEGRMDKTWTSYINTWSNGKWPESRCYPTTGHV
uniref:Uncharacterized protein n=1 Tax=Populus trichocarpa TaxID=3694 RepID=U7DW03_POPTR